MDRGLYSREHAVLQALLREVRQEAGLRQIDLAARLGVQQSFVSRFEAGERLLNILELRRVCLALGVPLDEFARRLDRALHEVAPPESGR